MTEKNVNKRLLIIGLVLVIGIYLLYPPEQRLRPGLDIAGGTSLIYEIDTADVQDTHNLAERVKALLQKRVDPNGIYNLTWRVHGRNRIEVQMPLPPRDAKQRRDVYADALEDLYALEIRRGPVERALREPGTVRDDALRALARRNVDAALESLRACEEGLSAEDRDQAEAARSDYENAQSKEDREERNEALKQLKEQLGDEVFETVETIVRISSQRAGIERGIADREAALFKAAGRYDALLSAAEAKERGPVEPAETQPTTEPATTAPAATEPATTAPAEEAETAEPVTQEALNEAYRDAQELFEDAIDDVLDSNLNRRRFQEILELDEKSPVRVTSLKGIRAEHPDLDDEIAEVLAQFQAYRKGHRFLDGPADLKRLLRGAGELEFRILSPPTPDNPTMTDTYREQLKKHRFRVAGKNKGWFKIDNPVQFFNLDSEAALKAYKHEKLDHMVVDKLDDEYYVLAGLRASDGLLQGEKAERPWKLKTAWDSRDESGRRCVRFSFDAVGGQQFYRLTSSHLKQQLCILVDDVAYSAANIQEAIRTSGQITGEFSEDKVAYLVQTMQGGALPTRLKDTPLAERTVGSSLGETNRDSAVRAGLYGAIAVILVMLCYYWWCGLIANVALTMNVLLVCSALAMLGARITLDGIAGIILAVGMAVDANVLIYERMREERARGASLRMIIKNGYDKALSTIFDSNITTLLTCIIIYYVGSEEVKGFGLTLGWGIVLNLFTSIFVTRTLFGVLLKYNVIKDIKMARLIGVPKIDWYAKRKFFIPLSIIVIVVGMSALVWRGAKNVFDVEFLGGIAAEIELKQANLDDKDIHTRLAEIGDRISDNADLLEDPTVEPVANEIGTFVVAVPGIDGEQLKAMLTEPLEAAGMLQKREIEARPGSSQIKLYAEGEVTQGALADKIKELADGFKDTGHNLGEASVNAVLAAGDETQAGRVWNVTSTVTNMRLVEYALKEALGDDMKIQSEIEYVLDGFGEDNRPYPIKDRFLKGVVPEEVLAAEVDVELTDYYGGAALVFKDLDPPQSVETLAARINNMIFQPDFQDQPQRDSRVIGIQPTGASDENGNPLYNSVVVVSVDPDIRDTSSESWYTDFAQAEQHLVTTALSQKQTLRKVMQFKPQIAARSTQQALVALLLAWGMIIGYVWIRFGRPIYGFAGVVALIHDVLIALSLLGLGILFAVTASSAAGGLLLSAFKIDMTIIAAMLTIIGYSINDTIVVFDRIRETRGRLGVVSPEIINASINQTLARTLMTSATTLTILLIMYIFGGSSIRGFNFCMMIGVITG
ncbi:MAG: protein translocase subunit SecD, partial [Phycisphaerae bacterium]|nr:protein translocase subunit SecD [Phycisphaerae bacterium]